MIYFKIVEKPVFDLKIKHFLFLNNLKQVLWCLEFFIFN